MSHKGNRNTQDIHSLDDQTTEKKNQQQKLNRVNYLMQITKFTRLLHDGYTWLVAAV